MPEISTTIPELPIAPDHGHHEAHADLALQQDMLDLSRDDAFSTPAQDKRKDKLSGPKGRTGPNAFNLSSRFLATSLDVAINAPIS